MEVYPIIGAYTSSQYFTNCINRLCAINTVHTLKLYCTLLNCPILAETQEFTEAFTSLFFHPDLDKYIVRRATVYRGAILSDKKLIADYKEGAIIITTTFLSTSTNPEVAEWFSGTYSENEISVFFTFNIDNMFRRTALNLKEWSKHADEDEILILRYIPFRIRSFEEINDGRHIKVILDECMDECDNEWVVEDNCSLFCIHWKT